MNPPAAHDSALVQALVNGMDRAYAVAFRVTRDPVQAEEAVQEAYLDLLRRRPQVLGEGQWVVYLCKAVRHTALNLCKSAAARKRHEGRMNMSAEREHPPGASEVLAAGEVSLAARAALSGLPDEEREAVSLCCEHGLSWQQAAEILEIPKRTLGYRLEKGLERLRAQLAVQGFALAAPALGSALQQLGLPKAPASLAAAIQQLPLSADSHAIITESDAECNAAASSKAAAASAGVAGKAVLLVTALAAAGGLGWHFAATPAPSAPPASMSGNAPVASPAAPAPERVQGISAIIPESRRIEWRPGIPGGIPVITKVFANVQNPPYRAKGDGVADDHAALQAAIDACPDGEVVFLPAGTYRIGAPLNIGPEKPKAHLVIRGAGPEKTKLLYTGTDANAVVHLQNNPSGSSTALTSGFSKGSSRITAYQPKTFEAGDVVLIDQLNDPALVNQNGETHGSRNNGSRCMGQLVRIASKEGGGFTLDRPLYFTLSPALLPEIWGAYDRRGQSHHCGIEDLCIENAGDKGAIGIRFGSMIHGWIRNVELSKAGAAHVALVRCYGCEVRDSYFHHGQNYSAGKAYGLSLDWQSTDNLIENNSFYYLRHSLVFNSGGTGNVIGYNYSDRMFDAAYPNTDWLLGDLQTESGHPFMNLLEGNVVRKILFGSSNSSSSHNTAYRNWAQIESQGEARKIRLALAGAEVSAFNRNANFVGNVFGKPGQSGSYELATIPTESARVAFKLGYAANQLTGAPKDLSVAPTLLRHGNVDLFSSLPHWDPAIPARTLPASLYLSSKPAWWGAQPWPPIGPDVDGFAHSIPAAERQRSNGSDQELK